MGFSLASPLAKFLNGLEILLSKAQVSFVSMLQTLLIHSLVALTTLNVLFMRQDWENNASRSVSLRKELESVTQLIIQWRKLELK